MTATAALRKNLRVAMRESPLTIREICQKAGYNESYVRKVVGGTRYNPTILFAECMATAAGVSLADLLGLNGEDSDRVPDYHDGQLPVLRQGEGGSD